MKIGIIGVGGAGNNIVKEALSSYYTTGLNINTNRGDIKDLTVSSYIIEGSQGVAQDRDKAKELLTDKVLKDINDKSNILFKNYNIVYVMGASGGGSGSGIIPKLSSHLNNENKDTLFIPVVASSSKNDSIQELRNTIGCLKDLWMERTNSYLVFDNSGSNKDKINGEVLESLFYPFMPRNSKIGNIDPEEIHKLFSTKGMASIMIYDKDNKMKNNIFIRDKQVKKVAVWADNIDLPDLSEYGSKKLFKGTFTGEMPKGILKIETGHSVNEGFLRNINEVIMLKAKEEAEEDKETEEDKKAGDLFKELGF